MNYVVLILVLLCSLLFFYNLFKKDFFSPSVLLIACYLLSAFFAFISYEFNLWNYVDNISFYILMCIIAGVLAFSLGEFAVRLFINKKYTNEDSEKSLKIYHFDDKVYYLLFFAIVLTGILIYLNLAKLTHEYINIPKMISTYRKGSLFGETAVVLKLRFVVMQMYRCIDIIGFILIYITINNLLLKDKLKNNYKYIFLVLMICFISLFIGGRTGILKYLVAGIFCLNMLNFKINKKSLSLNRIMKIGLISIIIGLPMFYLLLIFLGRSENHGFINYVTFYLGSPIASLQEIFNRMLVYKTEIFSNMNFGSHTFTGLQTILNKFGIFLFNDSNKFTWIMFEHRLSNNVYTGLYPYILDFGIPGVLICQFIYGVVLSIVYYSARYNNKHIYMIFYLMIGLYFLDSFRSEKLFTTMISLNMILYFIYMVIIVKVLFKFAKRGEDINE